MASDPPRSKISKPRVARIRGSDPTLVAVRDGAAPRSRRLRGDEPTLMAPATTMLFRPATLEELAEIERSGSRRFPKSRSPFIAYCYEKHARTLVTSGGWLTRFSAPTTLMSKFPKEGASPTEHYTVPASEIDDLNDAIVGPISILRDR